MRSPFLKQNNPTLRKIAKEIPKNKISSKEIEKIIKRMLKIAYGEQKDSKKPVMVGLAAPQIGISKRIILVDTKADGKGKVGSPPAGGLKVYINPEITWESKRKGEWYEGCYSTGKICGIVSRPVSIKIKAYSIKTPGVRSLLPPRWDIVEERHSGYIARIFQHEVNHLNGVLFMDHIKNPNHLHLVEKKEFPIYRNKQAWRNWPKKYQMHNCILLLTG